MSRFLNVSEWPQVSKKKLKKKVYLLFVAHEGETAKSTTYTWMGYTAYRYKLLIRFS